MRHAILSVLFIATLLLLAPSAWARGGRYSAPRGPSPAPSADEPDAPDAPAEPSAAQASPDAARPTQPTVAPSAPALPTTNGGLRGRRTGMKIPGTTDWIYWYEANRERFEDLRTAWLLTDANPIFAVGGAGGPKVGMPSARLGQNARARILEAIEGVFRPESSHWMYTESAAYIAIGKVAVSGAQVAPHHAILASPRAGPAYLQESAALGLGHLGRPDAEHQLSATVLDKARERLRDVLRDDDFGIRVRAFAGVALGMLAGQPSEHADSAQGWTASTLFRTWIDGNLPDEVDVGVLLGISRIDPAAVPRVVKLVLEGCALRGREWAEPASALVRAQALLTLAHVGDASSASAIVEMLSRTRGENPSLVQAAAIAGGVLGVRDETARAALGPALERTLDRAAEPGTRHLAWIALGRILAADVATGSTNLLEDEHLGRKLTRAASNAPHGEREFAQIACGLAVREVDHTVDSGAWQMFRFEAIEALRKGAEEKGASAHARAACCLALGIGLDRHSGGQFLDLLRDDSVAPELRAYAALGLGLLGDARKGVVPALVKALGAPRSELLRMRAATALGLLGSRGEDERKHVVKTLVGAMRGTRSQVFQGQVAVTLGRLGDPRAVDALVGILEGSTASHLNRATACAALGLLGDEALSPALAETRESAHYMATSDVIREILDVL